MNTQELVINNQKNNLYNELLNSLKTCKSYYFNVAFINYSGLQLLIRSLKLLSDKGIEGKVITSTYLNFTEPKALKKLNSLDNVDTKIFLADENKGFHSKAYIFEYENEFKIIIGSSNLTARALKTNEEWNVKIVSKKDDSFAVNVLKEYERLWNETKIVDDNFLEKYNSFINETKKIKKEYNIISNKYLDVDNYIVPNKMQKDAIENLRKLRIQNQDKALVIAATGSGKTYMSAFDVKQFKPNKCLFIAHRNEILEKSMDTYKKVLGTKISTGLYNGCKKDNNVNYLFASINTLANHYLDFKNDEFDYIVVDEAHHIGASSYQKVLNYFKPKFLLGMTATPERCDGFDLINFFDYNIALELRLNEALDNNLVVPFHYFGIDDNKVDLSDVDINAKNTLTKYLSISERVDYIIEQIELIGYDGDHLKALGFCVSIEHAKFMSDKFNEKGIKSVYLSGENSSKEREMYINKLANNEISVIFSVDIFNEGIDIPSVNMVLMLRPTNSPIVFLQQLGRGLRKYKDKEYLTVLDFIGNHQKAFLLAIALRGNNGYDKNSLKVSVKHNFNEIKGESFIQLDEICKERILSQISSENFMQLSYLKDNYMQFKDYLKRIPSMCDYLTYDTMIDPITFISRKNGERSYLKFVLKVEKIDQSKFDDKFLSFIEFISKMLPIKRPYEFVLMIKLVNDFEFTIKDYMNDLSKYINDPDIETANHAINNLFGKYDGEEDFNNKIKIFEIDNDNIKISSEIKCLLNDDLQYKIIMDILEYGLLRYKQEFKNINYGYPFLKLYETYTMKDIATLTNYTKKRSAVRGSGIWSNKNSYYLFVDLQKAEDIKESINYDDYFVDRDTFHWQAKNLSESTPRGNNIINNIKERVDLHLFVRKSKYIDGITQKFIYIGKADTYKYNYVDNYINITFKLRNTVPENIYNYLTDIDN